MADNERAIIAAMVFDAACAEQGVIECEPEDFTDADCLRIFRAIQTMRQTETAVDLVTLAHMFEPKYAQTIAAITNTFWLASNFAAYIAVLKEERKLREFKAGLRHIAQMIEEKRDDVYDAAQQLLDDVNAIGGGSVCTVAEIVDEAYFSMGEAIVGEPTGFCDLDRHTQGIVRGDLIVIAGRPSMGKSALAVNLVQNLCRRGKVAAIFSIEDSKKAIVQRMVCSRAQVSIAECRAGERDKLRDAFNAKERIKDYRLYVFDKGVQSAQSIISECYKVRQKACALDLVVVDYIGLMKTRERKNSTRQQELGEITRAMKTLAKDLNTTVILVSQLNRGLEQRANKKPVMSDLRESGDIEQDADIILFPYRPWVYDKAKPQTEASLIIAKNRNGVTGEIDLIWRGEWFLFQSAAREDGIPKEWMET